MVEKINYQPSSSGKKWLSWIVVAGMLLRVFFLLAGGKFYFGSENFQVQGDTYGWIDSIMNLIHHGLYSSDLDVENAKFFRPPGFAFLIGIFYFICGSNLTIALQALSWTQIFLDTLAIWMVFHITFRISGRTLSALLAALLYAFYPFIIVWTPVLYAEATSVFFLITSLYFLLKHPESKKHLIVSGLFTGMAVLTRLQCIFIVPAIGIYFLLNRHREGIKRGLVFYTLSFALLYGLWPARNLIFHNRLVLSQDLRVGKHWSPDYMAFMEYIFSVKTDHQPQYRQITENLIVEWPDDAYKTPGDSLLLSRTIALFRTCGTGLSYFMYHAGIVKHTVAPGNNCDEEIAANFLLLKEHQVKNNPLNYYLLVPLSNLKKCFFKFNLYGDKGMAVKIAGSSLFLYRTLLIFLGLLAIVLNYKRKWFSASFGTLCLTYFTLWYFILCFFYRNIEMRYLLHCDLLLLIPLAAMLGAIIEKKKQITD